VVERGPEKAGVGGSIPSLATIRINNLQVFNLSLPFRRLSRFLAKYPVLNDMVLFGCGRVLVVRRLADEKRSSNSLGMCKMRMPQNGRRQPLFKIALIVDRWCFDTKLRSRRSQDGGISLRDPDLPRGFPGGLRLKTYLNRAKN
jgi:hypothetical protein